ncbi:MAG: type 4a pilus biogenesis protein PilO [Nitrospirae bacterium]|nr:type 4a pilus biogenesis protein PilO [Nitrospirota bacterium]
MPNSNKMLQLDGMINDVQSKIEARDAMLPTYQHVSVIEKQPMMLPMSEKKPVSRDKMEDVIKILKELVSASGLRVISINPDINSIKKDSQVYVIVVKMAGEFNSLRTFLLDTAKLSYVGNVNSIAINNENYSKELSFDIKIEVLVGK